MKIDIEKFCYDLQKMMNEEKISVVELANKSNVAHETIYAYLDKKRNLIQMGTLRKLATALNRDFKISGDSVTFIKIDKPEMNQLSDLERNLLELFEKLDKSGQENVLNFVRAACKLIEMRSLKDEQN